MLKAFITSKTPVSVETTASEMATMLTWSGSDAVGAEWRGISGPWQQGRKTNPRPGGRVTCLCSALRVGLKTGWHKRTDSGQHGSAAAPSATVVLLRASSPLGARTGDSDMANTQPRGIDPAKLDALVTRAIADLSAGYGGVMISLGNRLGLYKAMVGRRPAHRARARAPRQVRRALRPRVAQLAGRGRLSSPTTRSATPTS